MALDKDIPCVSACPLGVDIPRFIHLFRMGDYCAALSVVRERNPFPGTLSRICRRYCENSCRRAEIDEPVAIAELIRFAADYEIAHSGAPGWNLKKAPGRGKSVAVVGAGPAGIMCSCCLAQMGYEVSLYEAQPKPGGSMWMRAPQFVLPQDVLFGEVQLLEKLGVNLILGCRIGADVRLTDIRRSHDAIVIATGTREMGKLHIPGAELSGVMSSLELLRSIALGKKIDTDMHALLWGDDIETLHCARALRRLGSRATVMCSCKPKELSIPALDLKTAAEEGVEFLFSSMPTSIIGSGNRVSAVRCVKVKLLRGEDEGKQQKTIPIPLENSDFEVKCENFIYASPTKPDVESLGDDAAIFNLSRTGNIITDEVMHMTNIYGVFACGEVALGRLSFAASLASGRRAAEAVHRFLSRNENGENTHPVRNSRSACELRHLRPGEREKPRFRDISVRLKGFFEVNIGYTEEQAREEVQRCLAKIAPANEPP